jgi:hypothetical protein
MATMYRKSSEPYDNRPRTTSDFSSSTSRTHEFSSSSSSFDDCLSRIDCKGSEDFSLSSSSESRHHGHINGSFLTDGDESSRPRRSHRPRGCRGGRKNRKKQQVDEAVRTCQPGSTTSACSQWPKLPGSISERSIAQTSNKAVGAISSNSSVSVSTRHESWSIYPFVRRSTANSDSCGAYETASATCMTNKQCPPPTGGGSLFAISPRSFLFQGEAHGQQPLLWCS